MFHAPKRIRSFSNPSSMNCLPDDLLVQILSLLPIKQAASTSLLSKRWRTLFAFQHSFDFDDSIFLHPEEGKNNRPEIRKSFEDFLDRTLALRRPGTKLIFLDRKLKKFTLKCLRRDERAHIDRWIGNAPEQNVSELHLHIYSMLWFLFPSKVFTSTTLVKLSLGEKLYIESLPLDTFLPSLKAISLIPFFKDEILPDVFLVACPSLEKLTLHNNSFSRTPKFISSKTIKRLSVTYMGTFYNDESNINISLDTRSLVDLYYSDYARPISPHCNLDSLAKATLDLGSSRRGELFDRNVANLIRVIHNVQTLHFTSSTVEVISICCEGRLPMFENLVDLEFSSNKGGGWEVLLPLLLEHSPNLKSLVLSGLNHYTYGHPFVGIRIPTNIQVKMLHIMQYQGSVEELKHIEHFLLKMESLELVKVYVDDPEKVQQLTEDMLKLKTASSKVKIQVM